MFWIFRRSRPGSWRSVSRRSISRLRSNAWLHRSCRWRRRRGWRCRPTSGVCPGIHQRSAARVEQMLLNLLSNAVKFTEQGSVKLSHTIARDGRPGRPGLACPGRGHRHRNSGRTSSEDVSGLPADRYRDFPAARGTGPGLAISRRLAERLGGGIQVESEFDAVASLRSFCLSRGVDRNEQQDPPDRG